MPDETTEPVDPGPPPFFGDRAYAIIKALAQVILPAAGSAYFGLASIWGIPEPEKVVGSLTIITTFLGVILAVSSRNYVRSGTYVDGQMRVVDRGGRKLYSIEINGDPEKIIDEKPGVILEVVKENGENPAG